MNYIIYKIFLAGSSGSGKASFINYNFKNDNGDYSNMGISFKLFKALVDKDSFCNKIIRNYF